MTRSAREQLPGYLGLSYYAKWLGGLLRLLAERELVLPAEVDAGHSMRATRPVKRVLHAAEVAPLLSAGSPFVRTLDAAPRFAIGDRVRMRAEQVEHHTRLPGYARGRVGQVVALHGAHVFPDSNAHGNGESPRWLYTVQFDARTLWPEASGAHFVSIDAFEPYLEAA
jgi:nitrile hydratase